MWCGLVLATTNEVDFRKVVHKKVHRVLDLTLPIVKEDISVDLLEYDTRVYKDVLPYYLAVHETLQNKLAHMVISLKEANLTAPRKWLYATSTGQIHGPFVLYVVHIPLSDTPIPGYLSLDIRTVYTHALQKLPERIGMYETQALLCEWPYYFSSPYMTDEYQLMVQLPKNVNLLSYTHLGSTPPQKVVNKLDYMNHQHVAPFSVGNITIHYEYNTPILNVERLVRTHTVSHWGASISVDEEYTIKNLAAELKTGFSRIDYQKALYLSQTQQVKIMPVIHHLNYIFPSHAYGIYYRDEVGNVSTSQLHYQPYATIMNLRPRYPLMGGWKTSFTIGHQLPLSYYLRRISNVVSYERKYVLTLPFLYPSSMNTMFNEVIMKIVLPEGSHSITVEVPYVMDDKRFETAYTYLDSVRRPVLVLVKRNAVEEHAQPIFVSLRIHLWFQIFVVFRYRNLYPNFQ
jgi:oligosaccharyltransferase complex subunit alpha (ribophorin I)